MHRSPASCHPISWSRVLLASSAAAAGIIFLTQAEAVGAGVSRGLAICVEVVLPSLFCFFVITNFILLSGFNRLLSLPLWPVTKYLFRLPPELGCVVLMSLTGGYPVGAKALASLREQGRISAAQASRMLCFCCCSGPSFVVTAVGVGMFSSYRVGVALYAIQVLSVLLLGGLLSLGKQEERLELPRGAGAGGSYSAAFVQAVQTSVTTMLQMCGYILLFCAVLELLQTCSLPSWAAQGLGGFLEVTTGCMVASALPGRWGFVLVSFFLAFGGISVLCQIGGIVKDSGIPMAPFVSCRILHGLLAGGISWLYLQFCPDTLAVFAPAPPRAVVESNTPILTLCLLVMCSFLLLADSNQGYFYKKSER